jgi:uncharacterized protein YwqG
MGIFDNLFRRNKEENLDGYLDYINSIEKPAVLLESGASDGFSKIGGLPDLPESVEWPAWKGKPLSFLCQIDLSSIPEKSYFSGYPESGFLFFFYDQEQETWGFDPEDRGSWKVIYLESLQSGGRTPAPEGLEKEYIYGEKFLKFSMVHTYPCTEDDKIAKLNLSNEQSDMYDERYMSIDEDNPYHQLFGYPLPEQDPDMEMECQLVTHGIYCGDPSGYQDPRVKELEKGAADWALLLQLDTDDDVDMMWGDAGRLYFWIRKEDLEKKNFDDVWMILQCG